MTEVQQHRASQILGFVNLTLGKMPNTKTPTQDQAQFLIRAAMFEEKDEVVVNHCNEKFKEWYNCEG